MEHGHGPFEDIFPIENGDIPASYVSLPEGKDPTLGAPKWMVFTVRWSYIRCSIFMRFKVIPWPTVDGSETLLTRWYGSLSHYLQSFIHPRWWSPDFWTINTITTFCMNDLFEITISKALCRTICSPITLQWVEILNGLLRYFEMIPSPFVRILSLQSNKTSVNWAMKKEGPWLFVGYIGDEILPSYMGIKINHSKDPY